MIKGKQKPVYPIREQIEAIHRISGDLVERDPVDQYFLHIYDPRGGMYCHRVFDSTEAAEEWARAVFMQTRGTPILSTVLDDLRRLDKILKQSPAPWPIICGPKEFEAKYRNHPFFEPKEPTDD